MQAYIIRRLLLIIPTMVLVTIICFFSVRFIPGDVVAMMLQEKQHATQVDMDALRHALGLDVPDHVQYWRWLTAIVRGDLGKSLWTGDTVASQVARRLPITFELGILALLTSQIIAIPIGIYSAIRQDTLGDYLARSLAVAFIALPSFWLGTMVIVYPSIWWQWTPPMEYIAFTQDPIANLQLFAIPSVILGMVISGTTMRMTRTMMLEVLRHDYIRTAWSKGLKERVVVMRHALKNALIPVITIIGLQIPLLIGGAVVTEQIFSLPGVGRLMLGALSDRDYPLVSGINVCVAVFVLVINIVVDFTYSWLDPRIRYK
ncbi:MAG: ABC transporter permease [Dehalococcoidales bacterium]|nr:ABC transporter permease [Dehalococcoidales bacterium]